MSDLDRAAVLDALDAVYQNVTAVAGGLGEADLMRPSRCAGWAVADVLYHELLDARRALRTFASPAESAAGPRRRVLLDRLRPRRRRVRLRSPVRYAEESAAHARYVRIAAAAYPPGALAWEWSETAPAAVRAGRACGYPGGDHPGARADRDRLRRHARRRGRRALPGPDRGPARCPRARAGLAGAGAAGSRRHARSPRSRPPGTTSPPRSRAPAAIPSPTPTAGPWAPRPASSPCSPDACPRGRPGHDPAAPRAAGV